jgi:hypothetical protein
LGIAIQLKIMSEVVNFLGQILSILAYGGSSAVKLSVPDDVVQ